MLLSVLFVPGDRIALLLATPSWLEAEVQREEFGVESGISEKL